MTRAAAAARPTVDSHRLLATSIHSAIDDLLTGPDAQRREAFQWLYGSDSRRPMTFLWCCDALGLDPIRLRAQCYARRPALLHALHRLYPIGPTRAPAAGMVALRKMTTRHATPIETMR